MTRYSRRLQGRHESAKLVRVKTAATQARFGAPPAMQMPARPAFRRPGAPSKCPRLIGPRYVRDGNVITLVPTQFGAWGRCTCKGRHPKRRAA